MELYHGSHQNTDGLILHEGLCLAEREDVAEAYAGMSGTLYAVELDLDALTVAAAPDFDHDSADCAADHAEYRAERRTEGVDVLTYEDEDEQGRMHTCYRLISDRALSMATWEAV